MKENEKSLSTLHLMNIFLKLLSFYGPQHWWPADTPFEVAIGAILTQNTNWKNAQRAIENLKKENLLKPEALKEVSTERLSELIKSSGYYNIKSKKIKAFIDFLYQHSSGEIVELKNIETNKLRGLLLSVYGIGPETADSILLYSLELPVFVVDAYTKRILSRHKIINNRASYDEIQKLFHSMLKRDVKLFSEYHALIVRLGKEFCKPKPLCNYCPIKEV